MIDVLFVLFAIYIIYQLVFNFIVPVSKTASQVRSKMYEMNSQQPKNNNTNQQKTSAGQTAAKPSKHSDEYIDFEEIK